MQPHRIGPFALEESLDQRGSANVLRGIHLERKLSMAVKLLPQSLINRPMGGNTFSSDVKRLQRLLHPGIARYLGGAVEAGQPYLALEQVSGESLRDLLDRRGKLPWEMACEIADEICLALLYAHEQGFVHQRLTPSRVLLPVEGGVKLIGFDCAWSDRDAVLGLRSPMEVAHYLAPEEFRGKQSASLPPCDLFSVGVILYECLSGELPWPANSVPELVQARRAADAPRIAARVLDCPKWLDVLTTKLLAIKRSDRISSADDAHRAIVTAKQKVADGVGAAQQALSGRRGMFQVDADRSEIRRLQIPARNSAVGKSPFYERVWFLAMALVVLIAGGVWSLLPAGEATLIERARPFMMSDSPVDWKRAEPIVKEIMERFPDTRHADEIHKFLELVAMDKAEARARNNDRLGRAADSEAERLYTEAWNLEKNGDRISAWQKYESLANLIGESEDEFDRAFVGLARLRIEKLKSDPLPGKSQADFVRDKIASAKKMIAAGNLFEARRVLDDLVSSYDGNRELQPLVDQARAQIQNLTKQP